MRTVGWCMHMVHATMQGDWGKHVHCCRLGVMVERGRSGGKLANAHEPFKGERNNTHMTNRKNRWLDRPDRRWIAPSRQSTSCTDRLLRTFWNLVRGPWKLFEGWMVYPFWS
jgi:hypothetical protein